MNRPARGKRLAFCIAIREALTEEMERDESVFLMGEDVGEFGGCFGVTRNLIKKFGAQRVIDTPISENSFVGVGIGAAMAGLRPVVEIMFMDFITLAMDQLVNHAGKFHYIYGGQVNVPIVIRTASGAGRAYGATHSQSLEAWLTHIPGLKVVAPAFADDAKGLLKAAIRDNNPVVFIENKSLYSTIGQVQDGVPPLGKALVRKAGSDITLISYSRMTHEALAAADILISHGIKAEVIDLRSLKPLDTETLIASVRKTGRALVIEEGHKAWGVGAEISCRLTEQCFQDLERPIERMGFPATPIPCGYELEQQLLPQAKDIVAKAQKIVNGHA